MPRPVTQNTFPQRALILSIALITVSTIGISIISLNLGSSGGVTAENSVLPDFVGQSRARSSTRDNVLKQPPATSTTPPAASIPPPDKNTTPGGSDSKPASVPSFKANTQGFPMAKGDTCGGDTDEKLLAYISRADTALRIHEAASLGGTKQVEELCGQNPHTIYILDGLDRTTIHNVIVWLSFMQGMVFAGSESSYIVVDDRTGVSTTPHFNSPKRMLLSQLPTAMQERLTPIADKSIGKAAKLLSLMPEKDIDGILSRMGRTRESFTVDGIASCGQVEYNVVVVPPHDPWGLLGVPVIRDAIVNHDCEISALARHMFSWKDEASLYAKVGESVFYDKNWVCNLGSTVRYGPTSSKTIFRPLRTFPPAHYGDYSNCFQLAESGLPQGTIYLDVDSEQLMNRMGNAVYSTTMQYSEYKGNQIANLFVLSHCSNIYSSVYHSFGAAAALLSKRKQAVTAILPGLHDSTGCLRAKTRSGLSLVIFALTELSKYKWMQSYHRLLLKSQPLRRQWIKTLNTFLETLE